MRVRNSLFQEPADISNHAQSITVLENQPKTLQNSLKNSCLWHCYFQENFDLL